MNPLLKLQAIYDHRPCCDGWVSLIVDYTIDALFVATEEQEYPTTILIDNDAEEELYNALRSRWQERQMPTKDEYQHMRNEQIREMEKAAMRIWTNPMSRKVGRKQLRYDDLNAKLREGARRNMPRAIENAQR